MMRSNKRQSAEVPNALIDSEYPRYAAGSGLQGRTSPSTCDGLVNPTVCRGRLFMRTPARRPPSDRAGGLPDNDDHRRFAETATEHQSVAASSITERSQVRNPAICATARRSRTTPICPRRATIKSRLPGIRSAVSRNNSAV